MSSSLFVEYETGAIQNKFILATDHVVVRHDDGAVDGTRLQHGFTPLALAGVVRRS
jgi:hypothetical protein